MPEDMNFESLLAEFNQAYQEAEEFSDWMPPDDEYVVVVTKSNKDVTEKDDKKMGWWKLTAKILAPENPDLNGQEFCLGFYNTNALGILKGQVKALNSGVAVNSLAEANAIFTAAVGKALRVKVSTTTSRKNGQEYTNCYIQEVLPGIQVADESQAATPPQGECPDSTGTPPQEEVQVPQPINIEQPTSAPVIIEQPAGDGMPNTH